MSNCNCVKRLRTSIPCAASGSLRRTRKVSAMLLSDAPCQARLNRGNAGAKLNVCADLLESQLERTDHDERIEGTQMPHVPDAHELALHLILPALNRHAEVVAQVLDQLAAVQTFGNHDAGDAGGRVVGRDQLQAERGGGVAGGLGHQCVTSINLWQAFGVNQLE